MKMVQVHRSAEALFLFNDRDDRFSCKKATSSTKSRIPISKRPDTGLAACFNGRKKGRRHGRTP